ncbi:MAG: hypothetical protein K2Y51_26115 [Gammaproteobacteria bacterium]|nr:hypothetical protein [Gammaproteobacteria bacterium]
MNKFRVGEIAETARPVRCADGRSILVGCEVCVVEVFWIKDEFLYFVSTPHGRWVVVERDLRKKRPPEEPALTQLKKDIEQWTKKPQLA